MVISFVIWLGTKAIAWVNTQPVCEGNLIAHINVDDITLFLYMTL
jgi:hypothetical protein